MKYEIIYSSAFIEITKRDDGYYIESFQKGLTVEQFNRIIISHQDIQITNFVVIKDALISAPKDAQKFANTRERVLVELSGDELRAYITLKVDEQDLDKPQLIKEIIEKLNKYGIVYGIRKNVLLGGLSINKPIMIAEGIPPEPGKDSETKLFELKDIKPEVKEDGNVDHYELSLINMVKQGDWLGERIDATSGTPGKSVRGNELKAMPGKTYPLHYDKISVKEINEEGKTVLYALRNGAVFFVGDKIGVSNHLEIKENVDFKTGNVDFDGYLTVKGTVEDNFSIASTKDIEILGEYGVGGAKEIQSSEGSIYIKGGIAGKGRAIIRCKKNLYLKYVADSDIYCDGSVHIGFYCLNTNIVAKEVILDSLKGQIIGGSIKAQIKVISAVFGSGSEKKTSISVSGFERKQFKERLDTINEEIERLKQDVANCKLRLSIFTFTSNMPPEKKAAYEKMSDDYSDLKAKLQKLEEEKKDYINYLKAKGEGEITILKKAFPNTFFQIKNVAKEIQSPTLRTCYYYQDGNIKEM